MGAPQHAVFINCVSFPAAMKKTDGDKGITVKKSEDFSEWYSQVVQKAELADIRYNVQGFVVHMPWAVIIARKIYEYFEEEVERDGHEPMLLPTVIPEENLQKEKEHAGFIPDVFNVTEAGGVKLERKLSLRPTGETQVYPMYALWIRSYQDLPFKRYQSRITVFRNEMTTRPFIRGREFMFFETHDVFETHEDAMKQIKEDMAIMERVVLGKLFVPFMFLQRPQWDKFKGAEETFASDTLNPDGRRMQISSTHDLGTNFAKAFGVKFMDKDGGEKYGHQTCFGPGIWRIIAALVAIHGDDQGLVLPFDVAPVQIVIVPITFAGKAKENEKVMKSCEKIEDELRGLGYRVRLDGREGMTPGEKFNVWELKGVPLRIEIGPREAGEEKATIVRRTDRKKESIETDKHVLQKEILAQAMIVDGCIKKRAQEYFKENTKQALGLDDIKDILGKHRGFVKAPFCSIGMAGQSCAEKLKAETTAHVCGVLLEDELPRKGTQCCVCGKAAKHVVYIAASV